MNGTEKPPLGIMPRYLYDERNDKVRIRDVLEAMRRFSEAEKPTPVEWIDELEERIRNHMNL